MDELLLRIRADLQAQGNQQAKAAGDRFFKQPVLAYGVKSSQVNTISKSYLKEIKAAKLSKAEVLALCSALWASGYQEEAFVACNFTQSLRKVFSPDDFDLFASWVADYVDNWAKCDTLC
ncbi:MAG: DNA alkylation repair protein, partial [Coriobacteriales bacterium]|nr:DNA alkylation repair protein [Coriobacteriales bacterium]